MKEKEHKDSLYDYFPSWLSKHRQDQIVGATLLGPYLVPLAVVMIFWMVG